MYDADPQNSKGKKTLFISLIDGTEEDLEHLYEVFQSVPELRDRYHGIATTKPVQTMDPIDLIQTLVHIYNYNEDADPNQLGVTRTERFRLLYRKVYEFMDAACQFMFHLRSQYELLTKATVVTTLIDGTVAPGNIMHKWTDHPSFDRMLQIRDQLKQWAPVEGQKW